MIASRRSWTCAVLALLLLALGGCSRPAPIKGTFVLEPSLPPPVARTQAGSLRIGSVVAAGFAATAIVLHLAGTLLIRLIRPLARARSFALRHAAFWAL